MIRKNIIDYLFNLGVHIGHLKEETKSNNWKFLIGDVNKISLINLQMNIFLFRRTLFLLKEYGKIYGHLLFFSTNFHFYNKNLKDYLVHLIVFYEKQSMFTEKWKNGCFSNYKTEVIDFLNMMDLLDINKSKLNNTNTLKTPKGYSLERSKKKWYILNKNKYYFNNFLFYWIDFLIQIVYFVFNKKIMGLSYMQEWKRVSKFWRFYYYFKFYNMFFKWPDLCIIINSKNNDSLFTELNRRKIPTIGILDNNIIGNGITYAIPSNDDSILLTLFYFRVFINSYQKGKLEILK